MMSTTTSTYLTPFSSVSMFDFEQANASWVSAYDHATQFVITLKTAMKITCLYEIWHLYEILALMQESKRDLSYFKF